MRKGTRLETHGDRYAVPPRQTVQVSLGLKVLVHMWGQELLHSCPELLFTILPDFLSQICVLLEILQERLVHFILRRVKSGG